MQRNAGKGDRPGLRFGFAADEIERRRFARAVGADEAPQFAFLDGQIELVDREESAKADADAVERKIPGHHRDTLPPRR